MKTIICGTRGIRHPAILRRALEGIDWRITGVIQGEEPTGIDALAKEWASSCNLPCVGVAADWKTHGKVAGPIRNGIMVREHGAQALLAVWDGKSRGTADCVRQAKAAGLKVHVHEISLADTAHCLLLGLRQQGFAFRESEGQLLVTPISKLTPEQRAAIKDAKTHILSLLREEVEWERKANLLASVIPDFGDIHVNLAERMLLRWHDENGESVSEMAVDAQAYSAFMEWANCIGELRRMEREGKCPHSPEEIAYYRRGPHVEKRCRKCGRNTLGAGKFLPKKDWPEAGKIIEEQGEHDLFVGQEGAAP